MKPSQQEYYHDENYSLDYSDEFVDGSIVEIIISINDCIDGENNMEKNIQRELLEFLGGKLLSLFC